MMEEKKKNKSRLSFNVVGGDGIGGMVLLGGGLAVAGLMATFAIIKNRNGKNYDDSATTSSEKQDGTQGLSFFLQTPTTVDQNSCFTSLETSKNDAHVFSSEVVSIHNLASGDELVPITDGDDNAVNCQQEIFSDDPSFSTEESSLPDHVDVGLSLAQPENAIKDDSGETMHLTETENLAVEIKSPMQSVEEEDDDGDSGEENIIEEEDIEENLPIQSVEEEDDDEGIEENFTEKEVERPEGEMPIEENSSIQSVEEEDDDGEGNEEIFIEKEEESSEAEMSVENEAENVDESVDNEKLTVEEHSPTQSIEEEEEEEEEDGSEENDIEKDEECSEGKLSVEENPNNAVTHSVEKENEDEDENNDGDSTEEHVTEKEEESSEGTVCSSIESNVEAIWPAEMIEALSQELKEMNARNQNSGEKMATKTEEHNILDCKRDRNVINEDDSNNEKTVNLTLTFHKKSPQGLVITNDQTENDLKQRIWVWSILVLLLLLLLLHIHRTAVPGDLYHDPVIIP